MISLYTGTPGSGKSLHVASDVRRWAKRYAVVCNFGARVDTGVVDYISSADLENPDALYRYLEPRQRGGRYTEGYIKVIIDEAQILFGSRDWQGKNRKRWLEFFTQHRKLGCDVILVCQMDIMIDKQIRGLVEYEVIHRKLGSLVPIPFASRFCVGITYWYPLRKRIGSTWIIGRKRLWNVYDTRAIFSALSSSPVEKEPRG